ncbi:MAG: hypothetical protein FOGNACKC_00426 [Anaerolineae bacterium]|nr:hypothetical protein [Anaerolineae bacterium]
MAIKSTQTRTWRETGLFWLGIIGVLLYAAWINHTFADFPNITVDETAHLMWLRLIQAGFEPYKEVYITYPPVFPLYLQLSWWLWPSSAGMCWSFFGYSVLAAVAAGLIARQIAGSLAGVAAAFFMGVTVGPCHILAEMPSITGSLFAVWLAMLYRDTGRRWLLPLSAASMAVSLLTKIQSPFMPLVIGFIILTAAAPANGRPFNWRAILVDALIWGATLAVIIAAFYLLYDTRSLLEQTVGQHLSAREALLDEPDYWSSTLNRITEFGGDFFWLLPLALLGFIQSFSRKTGYRFTLLLWLLLAVATVLSNRPLRHKHLFVLLPLFSVWASLAVSLIWWDARRFWQTNRLTQFSTVVGLILIAAYLWPVMQIVAHGWQTGPGTMAAIPPANKQPELEFISKVTTPNGCLLTDDIKLAYWSGRLVPPQLAEISSNRFRSGHLTLDELIAAGNEYNCQVVVISSRIPRFTPDFKSWVESNYLGRFYYGDNEFLYVGKARTTPNPIHPAAIELGGIIRFLGHSTEPAQPEPGHQFFLTMYWESLAKTNINYSIFVQLRDGNNNTVASADHVPFQGTVPTSAWHPGSVIRDVDLLKIPPDLPPGDYRIAVGLYRTDTMERLPVSGDTSGENAIILGPITLPAAQISE